MEDRVVSRRNVIVVLTDQLRSHALGCYGNRQIKTPNIDTLSAEGFQFDHMVSNCPICMPARSALLSGQYARRCTGNLNNHHLLDENGQWYFPDPPERVRTQLIERTLPELLKEAGYYNHLIGKWHVHPEPRLVGFDSWCYPLAYHRYYQQCFFDNDTAYIVDEFAPFFEANKVRAFLTEYDRKEPFFLFYNISLPHMPVGQIPNEYENLYDPDTIELRRNVRSGGAEQDRAWMENYIRYYYRDQMIPVPDRFLENLDIRRITALYNAFVTITDDLLGRLMATLQATGHAADTVVLFSSDHGDMLGSHGLYNKSQLYDEAVRVPLILHGPGIPSGRSREQIAQTIDLMPTLIDTCGLSPAPYADGRSLLPVIAGEVETLAENQAFIECTNYKMGIRTPEFTYGVQVDPETLEVRDDALEFFDCTHDPYQEQNLAKAPPAHLAGTAAELRERVLEWHRVTPWLDNPHRGPVPGGPRAIGRHR